jgi:hypothetical protein
LNRKNSASWVIIIWIVCIFGTIWIGLTNYMEPMSLLQLPPLMLHQIQIENDMNNLLITLSSNAYDNLGLFRIDVVEMESNHILISSSDVSTSKIHDSYKFNYLISIPLGNITLTDHTNYYLVAESNKGRFTWYFDSIYHHQQPML